MKKILTVLLLIASLISLVSCSDEEIKLQVSLTSTFTNEENTFNIFGYGFNTKATNRGLVTYNTSISYENAKTTFLAENQNILIDIDEKEYMLFHYEGKRTKYLFQYASFKSSKTRLSYWITDLNCNIDYETSHFGETQLVLPTFLLDEVGYNIPFLNFNEGAIYPTKRKLAVWLEFYLTIQYYRVEENKDGFIVGTKDFNFQFLIDEDNKTVSFNIV